MSGLLTRALGLCAAARAATGVVVPASDLQQIQLGAASAEESDSSQLVLAWEEEEDELRNFAASMVASNVTLADKDVEKGLPKLVVIGAQKGGTTFLRSALHTHKRLGTCCHPQDQRETIECGFLQWIPKTMPKEKFAKKYAESMVAKSCGGDVLYDDRPDYLGSLSNSDIQLATSILPTQTLFVVTMRDPVPRMQSAMAMDSCMHGHGGNGCKLEKHLAVLDTLPEDAQAVSYGLYAKHLKRWLEYVPKERLQMLFFEEITKDPLTAMNKVVGKMGLDKFTDLGAVRTKPPQQEHCRMKFCGAPVKEKLDARFKEAAQCARFQKLYGPANAELAELSGSKIPLGWTKC